MVSEEEIILAFLYKRSGKTKLKETELYLPLSLELGWFSTQQAQQFIKHALTQKLLTKKGELLTPNFDIEKTTIPVGFYPSAPSFETEKKSIPIEKKEDILETIKQYICEKTKNKEEQVNAKIKQIADEKNILPEVAILLVAKEYNLAVEDFYNGIEKSIFKENEE